MHRRLIWAAWMFGTAIWQGAAFAGDAPTTAPASEDLPPASLVTLHLKDQPLEKAFAKFATAAHVKFDVERIHWAGHEGQKLTIDQDGRPYWDALAELCALSGIRVDSSTDGVVKIDHDAINWNGRPANVRGAFRIDACGIEVSKTVILGRTPRTTESCTFSLGIYAEPSLPVASVHSCKTEKLTDETGKAIPLNPKHQFQLPPDLRAQHAFILMNFAPEPQSRRIGVMSGTMNVVMMELAQRLDMSKIMEARDRVQEIGDLTFNVTTTPADGGCEVHIHITSASDDTAAIDRLRQAVMEGPKLLDEKGLAFANMGGGSQPGGNMVIRFSRKMFTAPKNLGEPSRLVWTIPTKVYTVQVPFEFKDLPLP